MLGKEYFKITLKNGKTITVWFSGKQLEMLLKSYNIPYVKVKK